MASPQYESSYEFQDLALIILSNSGCIGMASTQYELSYEHGDPLYVKIFSHSGCIVMAFTQYEHSHDCQDYLWVFFLLTVCALIWILPNMIPHMNVKIILY